MSTLRGLLQVLVGVTCHHERVVTFTCGCDMSTLRGLLQVFVGVTCQH